MGGRGVEEEERQRFVASCIASVACDNQTHCAPRVWRPTTEGI